MSAGVTSAYVPHGGALALMQCRDAEVLMDGPANTGKSFAGLWKMHYAMLKYPGNKGVLLRKTMTSLKASTLVTFRERVAKAWLDAREVRFWASRGEEPPHYAYRNGSKLVIGGMDDPGKIMSSEYDIALWDEATDAELEDWEALGTRMRWGVMPYRQRIGCCNPRQPHHWLNERANSARMTRILSHHEDNPACTPDYLEQLAALTGVRRSWYYLGAWAAAEGTVYEDAWQPERNHVERTRYSSRPQDLFGDCGLNPAWPRYLAIDWGYRAPLSVQWVARLPDGELVVYREIYTTMRLVEDVAREALSYMGWRLTETGALLPTLPNPDPLPREIVADTDAEDRATWERHFGLNVFPARKGKDSISDGIQAVTKRLQEGRLLVLRDSLVSRDPLLDEKKRPCGLAEEMDAYVWDTRAGRAPREVPMDDNNHAADACRYLVTYFDRQDTEGGDIVFHAVGF